MIGAMSLALVALAPAPRSARAESPADLGRIEVGRPFPHVWLPAADDGRPMSVAQFKGSRLVLHVFASW
jgi:hypothetical protein